MTTTSSNRSASTTGGSSRAPTGLLGDLQRGRRARRPPTSTSRAALGGLGGESDERVLLAVALAVRAVRARLGLRRPRDRSPALAPDLPWPDADEWSARRRGVAAGRRRARCGSSTACSTSTATTGSSARSATTCSPATAQPPPRSTQAALDAAVERVITSATSAPSSERRGRSAAVRQWTTVITGGPGTGKTTTVARLLALLADQARHRASGCRSRSAAPTGKAAARLQEAVRAELRRASRPEDRDRVGRARRR